MRMLRSAMVVVMTLAAAGSAMAQVTRGSDGSAGALDVQANTVIPLPPDGRLNYTTVNVAVGATVTFAKNNLNTPVYLLATGDVFIGGTLNVSGGNGSSNPAMAGVGGPGGFSGGLPGMGTMPPGAGQGPGGGKGGYWDNDRVTQAGAGAYGDQGYWWTCNVGSGARTWGRNGTTYGGPLLIPLVGGSGGGGTWGQPGTGGGGGGGAILVGSATSITVGGSILARGGTGAMPCTGNWQSTPMNASGSGGAIRLVAPVVRGAGVISVAGARTPDCSCAGNGTAYGRIRIDALTRNEMTFNYDGAPHLVSLGTFLAVDPPTVPKLEVVSVAGQAVPPGQSASIVLPFGTPAEQLVRVRASGFGSAVFNYRVVLTPESAEFPSIYDVVGVSTQAGPDERDITVSIPANNVTHVDVWTY